MKPETFLNGRVQLHAGDSRDVLKSLADNSIDSIVCDPPYALVSIVKRFGGKNAAAVKVPEGGSGAYARASSGFMGRTWDVGTTAFAVEFWAECFRVLKPGGFVCAFGGTRTYHRLACAIEDAGFEVRDMIAWLYGSGFPKSHDVSKGIDKSAGVERLVVGPKTFADGTSARKTQNLGGNVFEDDKSRLSNLVVTAPATDAAREWQGWGTALKPANEPICLARKPLSEGTVAANVLKWGTGAINVDGCRVSPQGPEDYNHSGNDLEHTRRSAKDWRMPMQQTKPNAARRFPANVIHDGSDEVVSAFLDGLRSGTGAVKRSTGTGYQANAYGKESRPIGTPNVEYGDSGSAARFFYGAKADPDDRLGSRHPTVKPVDLMQWLCRLVTAPGGTILDPFAGTGTTGEAAYREGFNAVLIEREEEYQADIRRRMGLVLSGPDERARESIKARTAGQPIDAGPLFGGLDTPPPPRRAGEFTEYSRTNNRTDRIEVVNE